MISQKTRSTLSVLVGTVLIAFGTLLLVALASGYSIDILQGRIFTTALVLLNSSPGGASIQINGKTIAPKTPHRLEGVETGNITVGYEHPNYRRWQSSYFVRAGEVTFADYALLIPNEIKPKTVTSQTAFENIVSNPEKSKVALVSKSPVSISELNSQDNISQMFTPPQLNGVSATQIETPRFSTDGNHLLFSIAYPDGSKPVGLIDFTNGQFVNVSDVFRLPLGQLEFNPQNSRELFSLQEGIIRRLNTENQTISTLPLNHISTFFVERDKLYTLETNQGTSPTQVLVSYDLSGNNRYVLAEFPTFLQPGRILASHLRNIVYVSVLNPDTQSVTIVRRAADQITTSVIGSGILQQSFSPTGRFYVFVQNNRLKTIDLEYFDRYQSTNEVGEASGLQWLTDFQLTFKNAEGLHVIDFNGQNDFHIPPESAGNLFGFASSRQDKKITYLVDGKVFTYSLQPAGGLINFR